MAAGLWQPPSNNNGLWTPPNQSPATSPITSPTSGAFSPQSPCTCKFSSSSPAPTSRVKNPGRRIAQIIKLRPECVDEYKRIHAKVWPEVLAAIRGSGIEDYYIHYEPATSLLFATFRYIGYDYAGDMERMRENAKVREWWKITDAMQESLNDDAVSSEQSSEKLDDGSGGEGKVPDWWRGVESVFYAP